MRVELDRQVRLGPRYAFVRTTARTTCPSARRIRSASRLATASIARPSSATSGGLGGRIARPRGVEALVEQRDDQAHRLRVRRERVGEVRIGEAHAGLAEVLAERAHDHDVARGEAGAQHQPVQLVVLDRARPHPEEDVGDARLHRRDRRADRPPSARTPNE